MNKAVRKPIRKHYQLRVPVLPEEEIFIKEMAASTGLTIAAYLRNLGMGYRVQSILDFKKVEELARMNGDLGRLGGLLKLWLSDDPRAAKFGEPTIRAVLAKIEITQDEILDVMRTVVLPKTKR